MRIAFIGADSTGKTTLIDEVSKTCSHMKVLTIKNVTRGVIARGFPLGKKATIESYVNYIGDQLKKEREAENEGFDLLLSDRTILDALAYCQINNRATENIVPEYLVQMLYEVWYQEAKQYNLYVHCPIEIPLIKDGVREIDIQYRFLVGEKIKESLKEYAVPFITVSGSVKTRLDLVLTAISKCTESSVFSHNTKSSRQENKKLLEDDRS